MSDFILCLFCFIGKYELRNLSYYLFSVYYSFIFNGLGRYVMTLSVLICDDSALARKLMSRGLPADWDINISFAKHGVEAISAIKAGNADLIFLDLNMPVMDGYEVLETIMKEDLPAMVIVVSGDIQPEAHKRLKALGAIDFTQKPIVLDVLTKLLISYGLYTPSNNDETLSKLQSETTSNETIEPQDALQEVANIAMGQAGDLLARLLNLFVQLPIPKVSTLASSDIEKGLLSIANDSKRIRRFTRGY